MNPTIPPIPSPLEALQRLHDGNERFRRGHSLGPGHVEPSFPGIPRLQRPFAVILSCSDSRVPPEIVFDTRLGDLFVVRVAGNVASPSSIASIEFAVSAIGTRLVVVMGHDECGAVLAAQDGAEGSEHLHHLLSFIRPALREGDAIDTVVRRNARLAAARLGRESAILRTAIGDGTVEVATAFFHFSNGEVEFDPGGAEP